MVDLNSGLLCGLRRWACRLFPWRAEIAALRSQIAAHEQSCAAFARNCENRFQELADQAFAHEQLLSSSLAARPPGAREALEKLGDPAVSIILPTYNRARFVGEAIRSVQAQAFPAWELIVVDDGSTDDTEAVIKSYAGDTRIKYIKQENGGCSLARNIGIANSSAALIAYINSDNTWYPDFLSAAVDHFATHADDDLIYGALVSYIHGLKSRCILWRQFDRQDLLAGNFIDTNVFVHRRRLVEKYGNWDIKLSCLNDWDIVLRYTVEKPARAINVLAAYYRKCDEIRVSDTGRHQLETEWIRSKPAQ